jgi:hypothetical protein
MWRFQQARRDIESNEIANAVSAARAIDSTS